MADDTGDESVKQLIELLKIQLEQNQQMTTEMRQLVQATVTASQQSTDTMNKVLEAIAQQAIASGIPKPQLASGSDEETPEQKFARAYWKEKHNSFDAAFTTDAPARPPEMRGWAHAWGGKNDPWPYKSKHEWEMAKLKKKLGQ